LLRHRRGVSAPVLQAKLLESGASAPCHPTVRGYFLAAGLRSLTPGAPTALVDKARLGSFRKTSPPVLNDCVLSAFLDVWISQNPRQSKVQTPPFLFGLRQINQSSSRPILCRKARHEVESFLLTSRHTRLTQLFGC